MMRRGIPALFSICVASLMAAFPSSSASTQALFTLNQGEVSRIAAAGATTTSSPSPPRPDREVLYLLGARGALREILVRLALWPDERHLVRKDAWGFALSLQVVRSGDYGAALLTTARGFHFAFVVRRADFPLAFLRLMKTGTVQPSVEPFGIDLGPAGVLALRAVFELEDTIIRALGRGGRDAAAIAAYGSGFTAGEIFDKLSTPSFQALVAALSESSPGGGTYETRWIAGNEVLVAMELSKLYGARLIAKTVVADRPRYSLGSAGLRIAGLMFMPENSIRATRLPTRLDASKPELWPLRIVAYDARSSARFEYRPDGSLKLVSLGESDFRDPAWLSRCLGL